jgi:hypothetical protein
MASRRSERIPFPECVHNGSSRFEYSGKNLNCIQGQVNGSGLNNSGKLNAFRKT